MIPERSSRNWGPWHLNQLRRPSRGEKTPGPGPWVADVGPMYTQKPVHIVYFLFPIRYMYIYIQIDMIIIYTCCLIYIIVHTYSVGAPRAAAASPIPHFHPLMWVTLSHPQATPQTFQISWHVLTSKFAGETMLQNDKLTCLFVCVRSLHCFRLPNGHQLISANSSLNFTELHKFSESHAIPLGFCFMTCFENLFATSTGTTHFMRLRLKNWSSLPELGAIGALITNQRIYQ